MNNHTDAIQNFPDNILTQIILLIEDNKEKTQTIHLLKEEIKRLKKGNRP